MKKVVIVSGCRTAVGAFGGGLKDVPVVDLGATVLRETLRKVGLKPVRGVDFPATVPDRLACQAELELEKKYGGWPESARAVSTTPGSSMNSTSCPTRPNGACGSPR